MKWDKEIELATEGASKVTISLGILEEVLAEQLTKDEMDEFAGELIRRVEFWNGHPFWE
jgi:hypothetical protein